MDTLNAILSVPAVVALTELAKAFGVRGKWSMLCAVVLAIALNLSAYAWGASGAYDAIARGLLLGLAAAGLYDTAKTASS